MLVKKLSFSFAGNIDILLHETMNEFVLEVNNAIQEGKDSQKSMITELISRIATTFCFPPHNSRTFSYNYYNSTPK